MRAILLNEAGGPEALTMGTADVPLTVNSEFLVKVVASGVNPIDAKTRSGRGVTPAIPSFPAILGNEFSGVVIQAPYEAHPIKVGDEVYGMTGFPRYSGSYAEFVAVSSLSIARKPKALSHVEAAGVPLAALTAWGMVVEVAKAHEGQRILIHAGAGGVGHFAVQFARFFGAYVVATGSTRNLGWLKELGANEVVDYTDERFEDVVDTVDAVIDLIGNVHDNTGSRSLEVVRHGGIIINAPSGSWPEFMAEATAAGLRATTYKVAADGANLSVISRLLESGDVRVFVDQVFDLDAAADAHRALETGHTRGKIVLKVSDY
jgi:NADPH:quinone reductase-like Zn-dependent oxidoreductase